MDCRADYLRSIARRSAGCVVEVSLLLRSPVACVSKPSQNKTKELERQPINVKF